MARRIPSLNALRAFEAAGRHGRMTLAADELHVTHSAVSRQVQHLEAMLGVPLFEGPKNRMRLTEAGIALLAGLGSAFDQIDASVRAVADTDEGPLDVSCPGTFTMRWLIPRLYRFQSDFPKIEVRLTASSRAVDFERDGFDVAIRVGDPPWPAGADVIALFPEQIGPVLAAVVWNERQGDLDGLAQLYTQTRPLAWSDWTSRSQQHFSPGPKLDYEHFYFMLEAARGGLGVSAAPWPYVADDIAAGRLVAPFGFIESGHDYVALRRSRRNRKASLFCEWLSAEARHFQAQAPAPLSVTPSSK